MKSLKITFLNEPKLICLLTDTLFQVLQYNTNSFICSQLNGLKYCNSTPIILFNIIH